jgi:hypothetical protein
MEIENTKSEANEAIPTIAAHEKALAAVVEGRPMILNEDGTLTESANSQEQQLPPQTFPRIVVSNARTQDSYKSHQRNHHEVSEDISESPRMPSLQDKYPFYGLLGDLLRVLMPHVEADEMAIAAPFLTGIANLIGRGPHFVAGRTDHYLQFNTALVGDSAHARKSTAIDIVTALLRRVDPSWAARCKEITLLSGEGLVACLQDRGLYDDRDGDKRLFLVDTALAGTLKSLRRRENMLSPILSDLCDEGIASTRSSSNPLETTDALVSLIGDFNVSDRVAKSIRENRTGLDRRFLWFFVERSKSLPRCRQVPSSVLAPIIPRLQRVVRLARKVREMHRSTKAEGLWTTFYSGTAEKHPERPSLVEELKAPRSKAGRQRRRVFEQGGLLPGSPRVHRATRPFQTGPIACRSVSRCSGDGR